METELISLKNQVSKLIREQILEREAYKELVDIHQQQSKQVEDLAKENQELLTRLQEFEGPQDIIYNLQRNSVKSVMSRGGALTKEAMLSTYFSGGFNMQRKNENQKQIHPSEWDFVIITHNPDFNPTYSRSVSFEEAEKVYRKGFKPEQGKSQGNTKKNQELENKAFMKSYSRLLDHQDGKKYRAGGRLTRANDGVYLDHGGHSGDFLSLVRNAILVKLTLHLGLYARQVLSSNGRYIYILVHADDEEIAAEADRVEFDLQLELGATDLPSLEPCDKLFRPLRLTPPDPSVINPDLVRQINDYVQSLKDEFDEMFDGLFSIEGKDTPQEMYKLTDKHWEVFLRYLVFLSEKLGYLKEIPMPKDEKKHIYQKILRRALQHANEGFPRKYRLRNLWDRLGISRPFAAYTDYKKQIDPDSQQDYIEHLWKKRIVSETGRVSKFRNVDKYKLLWSLLFRQISLHVLQQKGLIEGYFPLINDWELKGKPKFSVMPDTANDVEGLFKREKVGLETAWSGKWFSYKQPINKIRGYFGEKIGLYFLFLTFMGKMLYWPSFFGIVVFIMQRVYNYDDTNVLVLNAIFCVYMAGWATTFMEIWRRKENAYAIRWGQDDYKEDEVPRPQYTGKPSRSPITDEMDDIHFPMVKRIKWYLLSFFVTFIAFLIVILTVTLIYYLRWSITDELILSGVDLAGPACSMINAIQIQIFNFIYAKIAVKLTEAENHRLQSEHETSLIIKTYIFYFFNSYNSLFYIAFLKTYVEGCIVWDGSDRVREIGAPCMDELYIQLITLFLVTFFKGILEVAKPYAQFLLKRRAFNKTSQEIDALMASTNYTDFHKLRDDIDRQISLPAYINREVDGTLAEYLELSQIFGYVILFSVAFPISSILAYFAIIIELRVDKTKLLHLHRRPQPYGARDIGTWFYIFNFICTLAIFTNVGVLCFTANTFANWELANDNIFITFSIFCILLIAFRGWIQNTIPQVPKSFETIRKRHAVIIDKFVRGWNVVESDKRDIGSFADPKIFCTFKPTEDD